MQCFLFHVFKVVSHNQSIRIRVYVMLSPISNKGESSPISSRANSSLILASYLINMKQVTLSGFMDFLSLVKSMPDSLNRHSSLAEEAGIRRRIWAIFRNVVNLVGCFQKAITSEVVERWVW